MSLKNEIERDHARVGLTVNQAILIISVQVELYDDVLLSLKEDALEMIHQRNLHGVLLDLSQLDIIDYEIAKQLAALLDMIRLLGVPAVISGLQPSVVVTLIEWQDMWQQFDTAVNLDAGLAVLRATR